jgi:hypothetical protein
MSYFALPGFRSSAPFLCRVRKLFPELRAPPYIVSATSPLEVSVGWIPGRRGARAMKQRTGRTRSRYCVRHCCRTQSVNVGLLSGACGRGAKHCIGKQCPQFILFVCLFFINLFIVGITNDVVSSSECIRPNERMIIE